MTNKYIITLPQDASAWDLIAATYRVLPTNVGDVFHMATLGLEEDFVKAKAAGEAVGVSYLPGPRLNP